MFFIFTDHKNLTVDTLKTQHVLCWHTKIEEFSPILQYTKGDHNILANNLSRLHCLATLAQIPEGKNPQRFQIKKKTKRISWILNTLVFMTMRFGKVLSSISTYLKLNIQMLEHLRTGM
jgi:hypothetical protein